MFFIPLSKPFVSGIQHHCPNSNFLRNFKGSGLGIDQKKISETLPLKMSINSQLPKQNNRNASRNSGTVIWDFFLPDLYHQECVITENPDCRKFFVNQNHRPAEITLLVL